MLMDLLRFMGILAIAAIVAGVFFYFLNQSQLDPAIKGAIKVVLVAMFLIVILVAFLNAIGITLF